MGSGEGPVSPRPTSRRHRRPHGDGADEASSPKRQKRSHHRHHHGHGNGDRGDQEAGSRPRVSAARPGEGEVEEGEIVDDAAAAAYRGPDAGFGKAGSVFGGLAPAPGCDDKFDANKKCREANHRRKRSEEIKEESRKEEDQGGFEHFAKQEEDDLKKTKEEARKRMNAILEKHRQRQFQKEHQGPVTSLDRDAATTEIKDANPVAVIVNEKSYTLGKTPIQSNISINLGISGDQRTACVSGFQEGIPMGDRSSDILCDDIFGVSPIRVQKLGNLDGMHVRKNSHRDNWDDEHGYYKYHLGEVLDGHYRITAGSGKGVFSTVVQAKDLKAGENDPEEVAIKIICNDDTKERYKSGKREVSVLEKLSSADRDDKRHCVWFISSFMYRDHLCLVLESLHMNLREVIKKFGRDIGLKLTAVRAYSKQLFIALKHLKDCSILHCDIKPDNILVNGSKNLLKLCDFGSALPAGINDITPILVSRFYRAPEIILGLPYDHSLDMWSVGCCLYELYTGKILFPGGTNNGMLWLHMELKGPFPKKMLRKGAFTTQHFDQDLNFHATDENLIKKKGVNKLCMNVKPSGVGPKISSFPGEDPKMLSRFKDLLEKMFVLDPQKRLTVSQALSHPFITGK
ncbi:Pkinase domain-containing protein [Hordeum vulgare]|uniref:non-specific serine/threonine protein kinase n=1 Tax=Hordeum vulgare subsp. vulgare TaxID=112509 RepID=A0A8I6XC17_HORVV|nr:serine/threonine-protein kinase prp4-like isoform X1 [Hordeum vulgare subsp. vulgare]KAE8786975.1 Pkinase domain-containing protein [Hordeum vulgare]